MRVYSPAAVQTRVWAAAVPREDIRLASSAHGQRVFFVSEHSRSGSILTQVRQAGGTGRNITTEYNNKFVLIEAQL